MNWVNTLMNDYYSWLKSKTVILPDNKTEWVAIQTPFIGLFNDVIEMYAKKKDDKIILSDNGETFHNLELVGTTLNRVGERKTVADKILLNYGVSINNNELTTETSEKNFAQKKHNFLSAIMELNDLYLLSSNNVASFFKEDVRLYLDSQNIIYTPDFISKGSTGLEFIFDFQIAGRESEIVMKSFNTLSRTSISTFLFGWDDIKDIRERASKKSVTAIAVINDEKRPIKDEFLEALEVKHADFILWSQRDTVSNKAKLIAA